MLKPRKFSTKNLVVSDVLTKFAPMSGAFRQYFDIQGYSKDGSAPLLLGRRHVLAFQKPALASFSERG